MSQNPRFTDLGCSLWDAAGSGKSRLALEVCHALRPGWNAGFLSRADTFASWSHFRPSRPTLVVIDYVSGRAAEASAIILNLVRSSAYLTAPVRVLLVERELGSWNSRLLREGSQSECAEIIACRHDEPLVLKRLPHEAIQLIAANVASFRKIPWDESAARAFGARMRTFDSIGRPLFAMIAAAYPNQKDGPVVQSRSVSACFEEGGRTAARADFRTVSRASAWRIWPHSPRWLGDSFRALADSTSLLRRRSAPCCRTPTFLIAVSIAISWPAPVRRRYSSAFDPTFWESV
jgi:hypothetical protein